MLHMIHFRRSYYLCHYLRKIATSQYHKEAETEKSLLASPPGENQRDATSSFKTLSLFCSNVVDVVFVPVIKYEFDETIPHAIRFLFSLFPGVSYVSTLGI